MDPQQLIQDGYGFASKAITSDQNGQHKLAHFFYVEASEAILKAIALDNTLLEAKNKAYQYIQRAEILQNILNGKFSFLLLFLLFLEIVSLSSIWNSVIKYFQDRFLLSIEIFSVRR